MIKHTSKISVATVLALVLIALPLGGAFAVGPPAPAPAGSTIDQRIAQRKAERGTALSDTDSKRVISSCRTAQSKLRAVQKDTVPLLQGYMDTYRKVDARLWLVTGKLKLAKQDTFELEKQRLELFNKVAAFQVSNDNYQQALDDAIVVNCQVDPNGFQALLDTSRLYQEQLRTQSADIRTYIVDTIKKTLGNYVDTLQPETPDAEGVN